MEEPVSTSPARIAVVSKRAWMPIARRTRARACALFRGGRDRTRSTACERDQGV
jgi:hypothetical protein